MSGNLQRVIVAVDGSEESMKALRWALDNIKLRSPPSHAEAGSFVILHVQSPPSIATGLNPGAIPFGGPTDLEVPAFTAAIEAHQRRITEAILDHALKICSDKNIIPDEVKEKLVLKYDSSSLVGPTAGISHRPHLVNVKTDVVIGDPKEKICEAAVNLHADLLVMGSRAFGPIRRAWIIGDWSHPR
ncbi:hypothetical protein CK203_033121 [Vitis vinifera]|uniref:UspA domain-containing protein n=1 Tax=Vitis vinifera TaxID=29760 RepID=A0A438G056_VITVI|nr:hypothetical protein CK203_033121 [Vitis vinifera]